jgi:hypothetical protein
MFGLTTSQLNERMEMGTDLIRQAEVKTGEEPCARVDGEVRGSASA